MGQNMGEIELDYLSEYPFIYGAKLRGGSGVKVVINPKYEYLSDFVNRVPDEVYDCDMVFKDNRNIVKKFTVDGVELVVKRYKRPILLNCFIYTFFRHSKARRSYDYAFKLEKMGVETAESVAYIEIRKNGFFHTGYYISKFLSYPLLSEVEAEDFDPRLKSEILHDFARFTVFQHEAGILNEDYNPTNVFFHEEDGGWKFAIVDTNRITFRRKIKGKHVTRQLQTMSLPIVTFTEIAGYYATLRGWNPDLLCGSVLIKRGMNLSRRIKNCFRRLFRKIKGNRK